MKYRDYKIAEKKKQSDKPLGRTSKTVKKSSGKTKKKY